MPMFARRPSTMSSSIPVEIPQNPMVGQQWQQISELHFDKFPYSTVIFMLEDKIQESSDFLFSFSVGRSVVVRRSGNGRFIGRIKSSRSVAGKNFSNFEMLDAKIASALNEIIQNSWFKKNVSLEEQKAQKEDRFYEDDRSPSWSTTTFEWLVLVIQCWIMLIYSLLLFMMITFRNSIQDGMRFLLSMTKIPSGDIL